MGRDFIRNVFSHEITPQRSATVILLSTTFRNTAKCPLVCACILCYQSKRLDYDARINCLYSWEDK